MAGIATTENGFTEFGPSFLNRCVFGPTGGIGLVGDRTGCRRLLREQSPALPGVYGWIDADQRLIYVGKSKSVRHRLLSYFAPTPADPKMERIRDAAVRIVWQPTGHDLLALLREQELIHRWRPEYNSQGQPHRRQPAYIAISDSAAPHAFLARRLSVRCLRAFGPITGTSQLAESVVALNHVFQLRDCADKTGFVFGDQLQLFADETVRAQCLRHELGSCPAPCASYCTRQDYQHRVERAMRFLEGNDPQTVAQLENRMIGAASQLQFERAAIYCNQWDSLKRLAGQLGRVRNAERKIHGVMPVRFSPRRKVCLVFSCGAFVNAFPVPQSEAKRMALSSKLSGMGETPVLDGDDILSVNLRLIVGTWFRKNRELLSGIVPHQVAASELVTDIASQRRSA